MPDGELRRPPQLWEQRLARQTAILSVGISSNGDATAIVPPTPTPGTDGGIEPAPVLPPPGDFIAPSQPTLLKQVQAINVLWDGLNSDGELWPYDTSWVEIHMSTTSGFSPSSATLKGRLARPGIYSVGGLSSGTTYYFKLRGADPAGNVTDASTQASSTTGSATSSDIVSVTADKITAGTVTGLYIAGGTIAGGYLSGGTISGGYITGGTISGSLVTGGTVNGGYITGGTIDGARIQSSNSGRRVVIGAVGATSEVQFVNSSGQNAGLAIGADDTNLYASTTISGGSFISIPPFDAQTSFVASGIGVNRAFRVGSAGAVYSYGIDGNTTANAANVRVGADAQLLKSTSTVRLKDELAPLDDNIAGVPAEKVSTEPPSVDPYDVLTLTPTEFRSLSPADGDARSLGFIAEDVAVKFPWAANWDEEGLPSAVEDRPIIAALVAVIQDLRARIEALEA